MATSIKPKQHDRASRGQQIGQYAELICRSNYSFLTGASHPHELMLRAQELGLHAVSLTDRHGVYGIPKAYAALKDFKHSPKLITGAELEVQGSMPVILLAANRAAYGLLCRILTEAHKNAPKGEALASQTLLSEQLSTPAAQGLIALPRPERAACDRMRETDASPGLWQPGGAREVRDDWAWWVDHLGKERVFFPLFRFQDGHDRTRSREAASALDRYGVRAVASNDVHYHHPSRRMLQDVLTANRQLKSLSEAGFYLFPHSTRTFRSQTEMAALYREQASALTCSLEIADRCTFSPAELRYRYPSEWIPRGHTAQSYLEELSLKGAKSRFPKGVPEQIETQLRKELRLVEELGFSDYFLTIWEIVDFARRRDILCQGRGSAANSVICYCLGITAVDPIKMNLLFERFISAERGEPPDIDVDFEHERREEVIQFIYERYGRDRAGMVSAVITYRSRSARRDIARALGADTSEEKIERLTGELKGFPRHLSIHSGGFTLSADPLIEIVPIEPARMEGRTTIQWDKYDLDILGLLKVDVLALGMLTAIQRTLALTAHQTGFNGMYEVPHDDPETYAMIQRADTVGVFQIESRAQMNMLGRLQPENFYDLVIEVALVRPGPIVGDMVHPYLKRKRGIEPVVIPDPRLEPILRRTLGVPLFQEQVMKMAIVLADFTPGEADQLRRAIGAWRSSGRIEEMGERLKSGLLANGLPPAFVELTFKQIQGFAEYGFPESHAVSFALLAYISSYLKCHYPAAFTCALLNSQPMGFYSSYSLIEDARRHGVRARPVHPNHSEWQSKLVQNEKGEDEIQLGFHLLKGLAKSDALRMIEERARKPFEGLRDFLKRCALKRDVIERFAQGDGFSCFGLNQRDALWEILAYEGADTLFSSVPLAVSQLSLFEPMQPIEALKQDLEVYGVSARGHPLELIRPHLKPMLRKVNSLSAKNKKHGDKVMVAGMLIVRQRPQTAKNVVFGTIEDEFGLFDLIFHAEVHERYRELMETNSIFAAGGILQKDRLSASLLVKHMEAIALPLAVRRHEWH